MCGAIGDWTAPVLDELIAAAPAALATITDDVHLKLYSSHRLPRWRSGRSKGHYWGALAHGRHPRSWQEASEARMSAGVETGREHIALHTDALGMQDLYYRRIGDAVYFAGRIEPLVALGPERLHVNWDAWASTLALTAPVGEDTPFTEIRRQRAASAWVWRDRRLHKADFEPSWTVEEPDAGFGARDAVAVLGQVVRPDRLAAVTLSGGWDSRLLGALAAKRRRRIHAWTVSPDDGLDLDVDFAAPVAAALGMRHRVVIPEGGAWADDYAVVRRRTGFQTTLHTWMMPLARELHRSGGRVLDGLAGGVLFKAAFYTEAMGSAGGAAALPGLLWESLEQRRTQGPYLRPEVMAILTDRSQAAFEAETAPLADHPAAATLATLRTRTARSIAACPLWLMAPEVGVEVPFVHPEVVKAAVRVPLAANADGAFYRRMLVAADPRIAALPSTNDPRPSRAAVRSRRQTDPAALRALTDHVRSSEPVRDLFEPKARKRLLGPETLDPERVRISELKVLHWASLLGHWLERHRSRLVIEDVLHGGGA